MATTDKFLGTIVNLWLEAEKVAEGVSHTFALNTDMIDVTNKDSAGFKEFLAGEHGGTFDFEGHMRLDLASAGTLNTFDLIEAQLARTVLTAVIKTAVAADKALQAEVYIASINGSIPNNDAATFSITLQCTGEIEVITNP